jgi:diguanylate cyclase (GGDEF)-like protein
MLFAAILTLTLGTSGAVYSPCQPPAAAAVGTSGKLRVGDTAQILDDPTRTLSLSDVMQTAACDRFHPAPSTVTGGRIRHWLRFRPQFGNAAPQAWVLSFKYSSFDRACVYWPLTDDTYRSECIGRDASIVVRHDRTLFTIPAGANPQGVVYAELESPGPASLDIELIRADVMVSEEQSRQFLSGLFNGILFLTVIYNVLFFFAMKDRASLYYAIHLAALGLAMLGFDGYGAEFVWPWLGTWAGHVPPMMLGVSFIFGNQYGREFLGTRGKAPRLDVVLRLAMAVAAMAVVAALFDSSTGERLGAISGLTFALSITAASALLALRGNRSASYLLLGISPAFLAGVFVVSLRVLGVTSIPPGSGALVTKVGLLIGAFTLTLGLNRRMIALQHDRDRAFAEAAAQQQIALQRAYFDEVTQMPNRSRFMAAGTELLGTALNEGQSLMVAAVDVVGFRDVNRAFGANADGVLAELGARLRAAAGGSGTLVARIAGNEFAIAQRAAGDPSAAEAEGRQLGERIQQAMQRPMSVEGHLVRLTVTIGISFGPRDGQSLSDLMGACAAAIGAARASGTPLAFYTPGMRFETRAHMDLVTELWEAVSSDQIEVHYQPQHDLDTGALIGAEALVRWRHPHLGLLAPGSFMALAEQSDLVIRLDEAVMRRSFRDFRGWRDQGLTLPKLAVNVSAHDMQQPDVCDRIAAVVIEEEMDPSRVELELTESRLLSNLAATSRTISKLRRTGMGVSLDDFGTGYSSLSQIRDLPISGLKVDKSFVSGLSFSTESNAILTTLVGLAGELHLQLVAEGIEDERQRSVLIAHGCHLGQGYLYSPALAGSAWMEYMERAAGDGHRERPRGFSVVA